MRNRLLLLQDNRMAETKRFSPHWVSLFQILLIGLFLIASQKPVVSQTTAINWDRVAQMRPDLKILVLVKGERPISLEDLALLADSGMVPADRDPGLVLGLRQAFFSVKVKRWMTKTLPAHIHVKLLDRFMMNGIYRVGFQVEQEEYQGPLSLEITGPRDGFGKHLIHSEILVRPHAPRKLHIDPTGNRWVLVNYSKVHYRETIRFHFAFRYLMALFKRWL